MYSRTRLRCDNIQFSKVSETIIWRTLMTPGYLEILNDSLDIVGDGFFGWYFCHSWWHLCNRRFLHTRRENCFFCCCCIRHMTKRSNIMQIITNWYIQQSKNWINYLLHMGNPCWKNYKSESFYFNLFYFVNRWTNMIGI